MRSARARASAAALPGPNPELFEFYYSTVLLNTGKPQRALEQAEAGIEVAPPNAPIKLDLLRMKAQALLELDRFAEAQSVLDQAWAMDGHERPAFYVYLFARAAEVARARAALADALARRIYPNELAMGYLALGDIESTFAMLRRGIDERSERLLNGLLTAPWWDPIRGDTRFEELLNRLAAQVKHSPVYLDAEQNQR